MRLIGLFIAIALAATAGYAVLKLTGKQEEKSDVDVVKEPRVVSQEVQTVNVLVAMNDIPIGTIIDSSMYDKQPWPKHLVLDQFIVAGDKDPGIVGMVTRSMFRAREPLIMSKLANPNDPGFLAAALPKGMRAVTIQTDAVAGVAGFVFPGDRVDVLFTHEKPISDAERKKRPPGTRNELITEALLQDIKVMAVDQRSTSTTGEKLVVPATISLETSQEDAQKLRLAEKNGTLSIALRSLKDKDDREGIPPTMGRDLSQIIADETSSKRPIFVVRGVQVQTMEDALPAEEMVPSAANDNMPPAKASGGQP